MDSDGSKLWTGTYQTNGTDPARINFKNGRILYFHTSNSRTNIPWDYVTPNGNYFVRNSNASGLPTQETLGRTVGYSCSACGTNSWTETYTVTDSNNQPQTYVLNWSKTSTYGSTTFVDPIFYTHPTVQMTLLNSITLPNGKQYTFEYNNVHGMLTKVTLPSGAYSRYTYTTYTMFSSTSPVLERVSERRVSESGLSSGEKVWSYTQNYWQVTVGSPENDNVLHEFTGYGQESATYWRTSTNQVLKKIENTWTQDYVDANGQPANGRVTTSKTYLNNTLSSTKDVVYDTSNMNMLQEKLTEGTGAAGQVKNQKDFTYTTITGNYTLPSQETLTAMDPVTGNFVLQGKTQFVYDEYTLTTRSTVPNHTGSTSQTNRGNLTTVKRYKDSTNFVAEHMRYDSVGNVVQKDDPLNHSTQIAYDDSFCTLNGSLNCTNTASHSTYAYPTIVTNALSQSTTGKYDYSTGLPTVATNPRGYSTKTKYDLMNRVTSITEPNGKQTTYSYDDTNRITTKEVTVDGSGNKGHVETYFDKLYRVAQTRTNDPEGTIAVNAVYDGKGRKIQVSNPYRLASESPVWTTTTFDATDRPLQIEASDGSVVAYAYAFNQTTVTDEAGNQRRYTYNPLGQMTKVEEPNPSLVWNAPLVTTYKYYDFGPLYRSDQSSQQRTVLGLSWKWSVRPLC
jgi:YD repeat-containing protein